MAKLYRGIQDSTVVGEHPNPFREQPRLPTATPHPQHHAADQWFLDKFTVQARSRTIMCTPSFKRASDYARAAVIEIKPLGEYTLIYSPRVADFYQYATHFQSAFISEAQLTEWLGAQGYIAEKNQDNLPATDIEVMADCENYRVNAIYPKND